MVTRLVRTFIPGALFVVTVLAVALRQLRQPVNLDTFFHLRIGHGFLHGWTPWDPGTITPFATKHWAPTQWLSQVVLAGTEQVFGLRGVMVVATFAGLFFVLAVHRAARRESSAAVAVPLVAVVMAIALPSLSARPQVISYGLVAVVLGAWLATMRDDRLRWWLVPLTWVWAMVHGMWPVGIAIGAAAAAGLALSREPDERDRRTLLRPFAEIGRAHV